MGWGLRLTGVFGGFAILIGIGLVGSFLVAGRIRGSDAARQKLEQRFDEFDADGDGRLTAGELPQRRLFEALDLDRDGVVTKPEARKAVAAGGQWLSPVVTQTMRRATRAADRQGDAVAFDISLTEREKGVLRLAATGLTNKEIAQTLGLVEGTVKNYMSDLMTKLESRDRTQAVIRAIAAGLL